MPIRVCPIFTRTVPAEPVDGGVFALPRVVVWGRDGEPGRFVCIAGAAGGSAEALEDGCPGAGDGDAPGGTELMGASGAAATPAGGWETSGACEAGVATEAWEDAGCPSQ